MIWDKFPGRCPYCQRRSTTRRSALKRKARHPASPLELLATLGEKAERSATLGAWQRIFQNDIYPVNQGRTNYGPGVGHCCMRNLPSSPRQSAFFPSVPGYFLSEAGTSSPWLMKVQNIIDEKRVRRQGTETRAIEESFAKRILMPAMMRTSCVLLPAYPGIDHRAHCPRSPSRSRLLTNKLAAQDARQIQRRYLAPPVNPQS